MTPKMVILVIQLIGYRQSIICWTVAPVLRRAYRLVRIPSLLLLPIAQVVAILLQSVLLSLLVAAVRHQAALRAVVPRAVPKGNALTTTSASRSITVICKLAGVF